MRKSYWIIISVSMAIAISLLCWTVGTSQSRKSLEKQRDEINDKIELTKKLIRESEKNQKTTSSQLQVLNEQLRYREQLLANINDDISALDQEIDGKSNDVTKLENQLGRMKEEYGKMIRNAYIHRSAHDQLMFLFASDNFNQAYKRFKFTQRYAEARKRQAMDILNTQTEIEINISELQNHKREKEVLATNKEKEKVEIEENKNSQKKKLEELKTQEADLRAQQKKQKADRDRLTNKIQEIIAAEIKKEQEAQAKLERDKAAKNSSPKSGNNSTAGTKPSGESKPAPKAIEMAPETKLANADFESNRGVLPWPVSAGVIVSGFGRHAHPSLDNVWIDNKGVDFKTEQGASAQAVFAGTVTSIFSFGSSQNIIVTHGSYKTIYSGLTNVSVKVGDKVTTRQKLGTVITDDDDNVLHFEVWKVGTESGSAQNPELWLKKK